MTSTPVLLAFLAFSLVGCAGKKPPPRAPSTEPTGAPATSVDAASLEDALPGARCSRGELAICAELAWTRSKSIQEEERDRATADLDQLCARGLADACAHWGDLSWTTHRKEARAAYERGCTLGSAQACARLGVALDNETPGSPRGHALMAKACDAGSGDGCTLLAETMRPEEWKEEDVGKFWALVTRGCVGKVARACRMLGKRERDGDGLPRDARGAAVHFQMACDGRDAEGCTWWGQAQELGLGTSKDEQAAVRAYGIACDHKHFPGCVRLGNAYEHGVGLAKDPVQATLLFTGACRGGDELGCERLALDAELEPDRAARLAATGKLCDEGVMPACATLGQTLRWTDKEEGPRALKHLELACNAKVPDACLRGYFAATATQRKKKGHGTVPLALGFLERACPEKEGAATQACAELASQLVSGEMVPRDARRGAELALRLCESRAACKTAGDALEHGTGVAKDLARAVAAYGKGCDAEHAGACRELARLTRAGQGTPKDVARADELLRRADELED